jgi:hypothetical protein
MRSELPKDLRKLVGTGVNEVAAKTFVDHVAAHQKKPAASPEVSPIKEVANTVREIREALGRPPRPETANA